LIGGVRLHQEPACGYPGCRGPRLPSFRSHNRPGKPEMEVESNVAVHELRRAAVAVHDAAVGEGPTSLEVLEGWAMGADDVQDDGEPESPRRMPMGIDRSPLGLEADPLRGDSRVEPGFPNGDRAMNAGFGDEGPEGISERGCGETWQNLGMHPDGGEHVVVGGRESSGSGPIARVHRGDDHANDARGPGPVEDEIAVRVEGDEV